MLKDKLDEQRRIRPDDDLIIYRGEIIKRSARPTKPTNNIDWLDQKKNVNDVNKVEVKVDNICNDHDLHFDLDVIHRNGNKAEVNENGNYIDEIVNNNTSVSDTNIENASDKNIRNVLNDNVLPRIAYNVFNMDTLLPFIAKLPLIIGGFFELG